MYVSCIETKMFCYAINIVQQSAPVEDIEEAIHVLRDHAAEVGIN